MDVDRSDLRPVGVVDEYLAWLTHNEVARRSAKTVNRMLTAVVGFYEFHGRRGNELARRLVVETRRGWGGHKRLLAGIAPLRRRGRAVRVPERQQLPKTLTLEQVAAVIDAQRRWRDRFLFALLASTGMRVGQALALRHEDVVAWERQICIRPRDDDARRGLARRAARAARCRSRAS